MPAPGVLTSPIGSIRIRRLRQVPNRGERVEDVALSREQLLTALMGTGHLGRDGQVFHEAKRYEERLDRCPLLIGPANTCGDTSVAGSVLRSVR